MKRDYVAIEKTLNEYGVWANVYEELSMIAVDSTDYSFEYVASWAQQDMKDLTAQMDVVRKTADAIVARLS